MDILLSPSTSYATASSLNYPVIPTAQIYKLKCKRLKRQDLTKLSIQRLFGILEELEARTEVANSDLVALLVKRDQLHLQNDSLRMEVDDILNFNSAKKMDIPPSLVHNNQPKVKQSCK